MQKIKQIIGFSNTNTNLNINQDVVKILNITNFSNILKNLQTDTINTL